MFQFLFCYILEKKDKKWFKRDIIVLISFLILFVSISFLVNIGKEMSLPGSRKNDISCVLTSITHRNDKLRMPFGVGRRRTFFFRHYPFTLGMGIFGFYRSPVIDSIFLTNKVQLHKATAEHSQN